MLFKCCKKAYHSKCCFEKMKCVKCFTHKYQKDHDAATNEIILEKNKLIRYMRFFTKT